MSQKYFKIIDITDPNESVVDHEHPMFPFLHNKYFHPEHGNGYVRYVWGENKLCIEWENKCVNYFNVYTNPFYIRTPKELEVYLIASNSVTSVRCNHKWKKYQGFTDSYEYCEHCDVKKMSKK